MTFLKRIPSSILLWCIFGLITIQFNVSLKLPIFAVGFCIICGVTYIFEKLNVLPKDYEIKFSRLQNILFCRFLFICFGYFVWSTFNYSGILPYWAERGLFLSLIPLLSVFTVAEFVGRKPLKQ
jgi:hypothetical protein